MALFKKKARDWRTQILLDSCEKQIVELENSKQNLLTCLGQIFFANKNNREKTVADTVYEDTIQEIYKVNEQLAFYENRKLEIQVKQRCEYCGNIVEVAPFCSMCGKRRHCYEIMPCDICEERFYCLLRSKKEEEQSLLRLKSKERIKNSNIRNICPECGSACIDAISFCNFCGCKLR